MFYVILKDAQNKVNLFGFLDQSHPLILRNSKERNKGGRTEKRGILQLFFIAQGNPLIKTYCLCHVKTCCLVL